MTGFAVRCTATWALVASFLLNAGCDPSDEGPATKAARDSVATQAAEMPIASGSAVAPSPALTGIWTVVGHHIPGISAMSDAEATRRHGETLRLTPTEALSSGSHCDDPTYETRTAKRDAFLATEYRLPPGSLKPLSSLERIALLEVSCQGGTWAAMGGRLIAIDSLRALAPWDGVFFELERDHDFHAAGQEPFWRLEIAKGNSIRFVRLGEADVLTPAPRPAKDPRTGAVVYHAITDANELRVVIDQTPCADVMSGKPFATTVTVALNGGTYRGCGERVP